MTASWLGEEQTTERSPLKNWWCRRPTQPADKQQLLLLRKNWHRLACHYYIVGSSFGFTSTFVSLLELDIQTGLAFEFETRGKPLNLSFDIYFNDGSVQISAANSFPVYSSNGTLRYPCNFPRRTALITIFLSIKHRRAMIANKKCLRGIQGRLTQMLSE